jgi:hypothetical protein
MTTCKHGHPLTGQNLGTRSGRPPACRVCASIHSARMREKKRPDPVQAAPVPAPSALSLPRNATVLAALQIAANLRAEDADRLLEALCDDP